MMASASIRALAAAVLLSAFETIQGSCRPDADRAALVRAKQALAWFQSPERDHLFSFIGVCDMLNLDPEAGRQAAKYFMRGMEFELTAADSIIRACAPLTCSRCGRVLATGRPIWTYGAGALLYCASCRASGECLPAGAAWRNVTRRERRALHINVQVSMRELTTSVYERLSLTPEEEARIKAMNI